MKYKQRSIIYSETNSESPINFGIRDVAIGVSNKIIDNLNSTFFDKNDIEKNTILDSLVGELIKKKNDF